MKEIIVNSRVIAICEQPLYLKPIPDRPGMFKEATEEEAVIISAGLGEDAGFYNLWNKEPYFPDKAVAYVRDHVLGDYVFNAHNNAEKAAGEVLVIEDAMCDSDNLTENRIATLEEALCDMDV